MSRTDMHRPAVIDPAQYEYVGVFYQGPVSGEEHADMVACYLEQDSEDMVNAAEQLLDDQPFEGNHHAKGTCDHCGAWFHYGVVYRHKPTGDGVAIGHVCSRTTFGFESRRDLEIERLKKRVAAKRERQKVMKQAEEFKQAQGQEFVAALACEHYIVQDIAAKLNKYGSLSQKQVALVLKIAKEEAERAADEAELPAPAPVVEGRIVVTGILLGIREQEGAYGIVDKMLVVDDRGFKVWCTVPDRVWELGWEGARRDGADCARKWLLRKRITFTATVEKSRKDKCFGFGKRPTKAAVL